MICWSCAAPRRVARRMIWRSAANSTATSSGERPARSRAPCDDEERERARWSRSGGARAAPCQPSGMAMREREADDEDEVRPRAQRRGADDREDAERRERVGHDAVDEAEPHSAASGRGGVPASSAARRRRPARGAPGTGAADRRRRCGRRARRAAGGRHDGDAVAALQVRDRARRDVADAPLEARRPTRRPRRAGASTSSVSVDVGARLARALAHDHAARRAAVLRQWTSRGSSPVAHQLEAEEVLAVPAPDDAVAAGDGRPAARRQAAPGRRPGR